MSDPETTLAPPSEQLLRLPALPSDLGYGEEHVLLRQSARRLLAEKSTLMSVRRLVDDPRGFEPALYQELAELGWLTLGKDALGPLHLCVLLEEMGRVLLPSPYVATLLALVALEAGASEAQRAELGAPLEGGARVASLALDEPRGGFEGEPASTRAERAGGEVVLSGEKSHVLWGTEASLLLVSAREAGGGVGLYAVGVPTPGLVVEPELGVDSTRRSARVALRDARVPVSCRLEGDARAALERIATHGTLLASAEMLGAADAVLEMTRTYACQREQFGKAIGSFQAVKHPLVDMMIGIELGRSLVYGAATMLSEGNLADARVTARMAKASASDVLANAVKKGVQLHGGFGFTWDADVHFFFKRMLATRASFGDATHHRRKLAARLFGPLPDEP